jgi:hypothetical protein
MAWRLGMGVFALVAVIAAMGGSAEADRDGCKRPRGSTVLAKSKYAVVYEDSRGRDFGCLFSLGQRAELIDAHTDFTNPFTLAGRYVAYPQTSSDPDGTIYYLLTVFDLRQGGWHTLSGIYADPPEDQSRHEDIGIKTDLVLKKNGSVAWISCFPYGDEDSTNCRRDPSIPLEVWRTDRRGTKLLDASTDLHKHSLKRRGSTITWRDGSETRTAQLK